MASFVAFDKLAAMVFAIGVSKLLTDTLKAISVK